MWEIQHVGIQRDAYLSNRTIQSQLLRHFVLDGISEACIAALLCVLTLFGRHVPLFADPPNQQRSYSEIARFHFIKPLTAVIFLDEPDQIVSSCADGIIRISNIKNGKEIKRVRTQENEKPMSLAYSKSTKALLIGTMDSVESRDSSDLKRLWRTNPDDASTFGDIALSPDGKSMAVPRYEEEILLLEAGSGRAITRLKRPNVRVRMCRFSPDGNSLLATYSDSRLVVWDIAKASSLLVIEGHAGKLCCGCFMLKGKAIAAVSEDKIIRVWESEKGDLIHEFRGHQGMPTLVEPLDGDNILTADTDGTVIQWDIVKKIMVRKIKCSNKQILGLAVSEDKKSLAVACLSGDLIVFDLSTR